MLGVLPLIQNGNFFQDSLQEVVLNLNLILSKINSTKVVRVNHPTERSQWNIVRLRNVLEHSQAKICFRTWSGLEMLWKILRLRCVMELSQVEKCYGT